MLFPRNALPSGPQACFFAEEAMARLKAGKLRIDFAKEIGSVIEF
jgi:hypothetical protein